MMVSAKSFLLIATLTVLLWKPGFGKEDITPKVDMDARVKQHRSGARGDLVYGEEDKRKIIIQWDAIPGALEYQVCHNCKASKRKGELTPGDLHSVDIETVRAGRPVFVKPDVQRGKNSFHVRASVQEGKWGPWSEERIFHVDEVGKAEHGGVDEL